MKIQLSKSVSVFFTLILSVCIIGCDESPTQPKVNAANVVQYVQESESSFPGVSISEAVAGLLKIMQKKGGYIEIIGWSQDYRSGGMQDVWFKVKTDDELSTFHWVITPDGMLKPANKLARNVTKS